MSRTFYYIAKVEITHPNTYKRASKFQKMRAHLCYTECLQYTLCFHGNPPQFDVDVHFEPRICIKIKFSKYVS